MITLRPVTSLDHPGLTPFRTLRQSVDHFRDGVFVAEGEKVVRRLLDSPLSVLSILLTPAWLDHFSPALAARTETIDVFVADKPLVEEIVGFHLHQGIMALGKVPAPASLDQLLAELPSPRLLVALDQLANAENIGVVVRNSAAFGAHAILAGPTSSSPYLRRSVRNSMGTIFKLPVVHLTDLAGTITRLNREGFTSIAAHPHTDDRTIADIDLRGDCLLVLGSEGDGITDGVLAACSQHAAIPMQRGVDSLNVASASAAFLYEVWRQRRGS